MVTYIDQVMIERYGDTFVGMSASGFVYKGSNERDVRLDEITVCDVPVYEMELDRTSTDPDSVWHVQKIDKLVVDIAKNGLIRPIWVTKTNKFVDGIHRLWAHILLGEDTIRCLTIEDPDNYWG